MEAGWVRVVCEVVMMTSHTTCEIFKRNSFSLPYNSNQPVAANVISAKVDKDRILIVYHHVHKRQPKSPLCCSVVVCLNNMSYTDLHFQNDLSQVFLTFIERQHIHWMNNIYCHTEAERGYIQWNWAYQIIHWKPDQRQIKSLNSTS